MIYLLSNVDEQARLRYNLCTSKRRRTRAAASSFFLSLPFDFFCMDFLRILPCVYSESPSIMEIWLRAKIRCAEALFYGSKSGPAQKYFDDIADFAGSSVGRFSVATVAGGAF